MPFFNNSNSPRNSYQNNAITKNKVTPSIHNFIKYKNIPISSFAISMGILSTALSASSYFGIGNIFLVFFSMGILVLFVLTVLYATKIIFSFAEVKTEFNNIQNIYFFPTYTISLNLFAFCLQQLGIGLALYIWLIATLLHFILTIYIISNWLYQERWEINFINPSWFIIIAGNIMSAIGGAKFGYGFMGIFLFSIGIVFWFIMQKIVIYRIFFHPQIENRLLPTLFILIVPPSLSFNAYVQLNHIDYLDFFSLILINFAIFLFLILIVRIKFFLLLPFSLAWWSYIFPLAVLSNSLQLAYKLSGIMFFYIIGITIFWFIVFFIFFNLIKTCKSIYANGFV